MTGILLSPRLTKIGWQLKRLRSMGLAEIIYRMRQEPKKAYYRTGAHRWDDFSVASDKLPHLPGSILEASETVGQLKPAWAAAAQAARDGRYVLLGMEWRPHDSPVRWHFDPVSRTSWFKDRGS